MKRRGDKRLSVLGAEDNVREEVRLGVGHVLSPLRGLGGILLEFLTHGLRHGLRSFARFAGCEAKVDTAAPRGEMPASHFSYSFWHAPVVDWRRAVLSVALTLLILDNSAKIGYSSMVRLADG